MNHNPRKFALALATAAALLVGTAACDTPPAAPRVEAPTYSLPDCDLDDLERGDADCNDPVAYGAAVKSYGEKKVAAAREKYAKRLVRERARKEADKVIPRTPARPATSAVAPRTNSNKATSGGGLFGGSKSGDRLFGGKRRK